MGIRKVNPTSPGRRFQTYSTFDEITRAEPEQESGRAPEEDGRPQQLLVG